VIILVPVCFYSDVSFLWYALIGLLATLGAGWSASWLFPPPDPRHLKDLTFSEHTATEADSEDAAVMK
jgi:hypothetical protein